MRKLIEYTLVSADGVFESPQKWGALEFRDEAYLRDGLGLLLSCEAMLMGRTFYESSAKIWPARHDPWATRLNAMRKIVFSSTLEKVDLENSSLVRGDVAEEVQKLKQQPGGNLLIWGHTRLARSLLKHRLLDVLDLSIHPVMVGEGRSFFHQGESARLKLMATKSFAQIVKETYQLQY